MILNEDIGVSLKNKNGTGSSHAPKGRANNANETKRFKGKVSTLMRLEKRIKNALARKMLIKNLGKNLVIKVVNFTDT